MHSLWIEIIENGHIIRIYCLRVKTGFNIYSNFIAFYDFLFNKSRFYVHIKCKYKSAQKSAFPHLTFFVLQCYNTFNFI